MRPCTTCGKQIPNKAEFCRICGATVSPLTLAEKLAWKHRDFLQRHDPGADSPATEAKLLALAPEELAISPTIIGELIWYVHPQYDACFCLGNVVSIAADGQMMCVEDKWKNTSYTYIEGLWTHIGHSCDCAVCG